MVRTALVCGAGGFIGAHLARRLRAEGCWVRGVDLKHPEFDQTAADEFVIADLREKSDCRAAIDRGFDEVYQLAADMGGAGYVFTGDNDADILRNSATINLQVIDACRAHAIKRVFFSSSACIYPQGAQQDPLRPVTREDSAYPADPDSDYGWEKLFAERLYLACNRNYGMECRVGRYHNVFGPQGAWVGGREKAPAALCRKVAEASDGSSIEIWGDGRQTRSFLYIDGCLDATIRLARSLDFAGPVNIGSEEMVTIDDLARLAMKAAGKSLAIDHRPGPVGVRGRRSDNALAREKLGWAPRMTLEEGIARTYPWIAEQVERARAARGG